MNTNDSNDERILDAMIQQATGGLSESEQRELDQLISNTDQHALETSMDEQEKIELTAAAVDVSMVNMDQIPDSVRDQVLLAAGQHFDTDNESTIQPPTAIQAAIESDDTRSDNASNVRPSSGPTWRELLAMTVSAACLALLLSGWNPFSSTNPAGPVVDTPVAMSVAQKMERLVESKPADLVRETWIQVDKNYAGVGGEVVWSDETQEGYMVFTGIKPNDPAVEQFQLWIFDTDPAQKHPVDGGVFDIAEQGFDSGGKIIVPIKAHIPIEKAVQFAVTVERPGGVTVSKRERIPVLAKLAAAD